MVNMDIQDSFLKIHVSQRTETGENIVAYSAMFCKAETSDQNQIKDFFK